MFSLAFIISISAVSAENSDIQIISEIDDTIDSADNNILSDDGTNENEEGTFVELQNTFWKCSDGEIISGGCVNTYDVIVAFVVG